MLVASLDTSAINVPTPAHQCKTLGANKFLRVFLLILIKRPCLNVDFYPVYANGLFTVGDGYW